MPVNADTLAYGPLDLSDREFEMFRALIFEKSGINLNEGKKELVRTRLGGRLRKGGFRSFMEYYKYVTQDVSESELVTLLDAISTNLTSFFREANHFNYLKKNVLPDVLLRKKTDPLKEIRAWSAGCSTGEEPYSISFILLETLESMPSMDVKLLATDLSTKVLAKAARGIYTAEQVKSVPKELLPRYFDIEHINDEKFYRVGQKARGIVQFKRFNLMTPTFPFKRKFDFIFCRNVMIYFDKPTQQTLINKFYNALAPGGHLLIGHSESLTGVQHRFKYVQPTIYRKQEQQ
ncbi:MAG: protein-glutamate O-methyltransferase CheR [Nitrospinae bacterium]|nr:protein-glutamate O-methyltransferase CheR [Nitrospinota bacterium]